MTDIVPTHNVFPAGMPFTEDQLSDAFYMAHRGAQALGRGGHGPRIVNTRWDLEHSHDRVVIRCVFVVKDQHYRSRYAPSPVHSRRLRRTLFAEDLARLEHLVRDVFEARAVTFDTLYVGVAMGEL